MIFNRLRNRAERERRAATLYQSIVARSRAAEFYQESWRLLGEGGRADLRREWYSKPVELPADGILWSGDIDPGEFADSRVVAARFTVNHRGQPRDVETTPQDPEHQGSAIRLYKLLRDSRFRPRLVDGEPVSTPGLEREYRVH